MYTIENENLKVHVKAKGAELDSIYNKITGLEHLWNGDPAFWGKKSPVLFPIVGALKDDAYYYENKKYSLSRHGFAREMDFTQVQQENDSIVFSLKSDEATLAKYPFAFRFNIIYKLSGAQLSVTYALQNTGTERLYFSVGGHPAFKLPFIDGTAYTDYYLEFKETENVLRWPISKEGLIEKAGIPFLQHANKLPLAKELFVNDALVFKDLHSNKVKLLSNKSPHGFEFDFTGFPFLGIWAAAKADFVCIEPWCGIADSIGTDQQLISKEGINALDTMKNFERRWAVNFF